MSEKYRKIQIDRMMTIREIRGALVLGACGLNFYAAVYVGVESMTDILQRLELKGMLILT